MGRKVIDTDATCRNLREMLEERKISANEVQHVLDLKTVQAVYRWLSPNNQTMPSLDNLIQLADLMDCDLEDIIVRNFEYYKKRRGKNMICPKCGAQIEEKRDACSSRDLIRLGRYLQDYKEALGVKAIEWRVLARYKNGMILMTTKDAIAGRRFHEMENFISWEDCELRGWLNDTFFHEAFNPAEQEIILPVRNENHDNAEYGTPGGPDTLDRVFLLSIEEATKYFLIDDYYRDSICSATKYARSQGVRVNKGLSCEWWLRSPGHSMKGGLMSAATVRCNGLISLYGQTTSSEYVGVRPVILIDGNRYKDLPEEKLNVEE